MATPARFELATNRLGTYYSIQLSYGAMYSDSFSVNSQGRILPESASGRAGPGNSGIS